MEKRSCYSTHTGEVTTRARSSVSLQSGHALRRVNEGAVGSVATFPEVISSDLLWEGDDHDDGDGQQNHRATEQGESGTERIHL